MGEVVALSGAFESEFHKALSSLPSAESCPATEHEAFLLHHRATQRIAELLSYYSTRLPPYALVPRLLLFGDRLVQQGEHKLAVDECYSYVQGLSLITTALSLQRMDVQAKLSYHTQACFGVAVCKSALTLAMDPAINHPDTLQQLVTCLNHLKAAVLLVIPSEPLYWLTLNGTVHMYTIAKRMLVAGFAQQALPSLIFALKALESHVIFSTARYLPWRTQLYATLTHAYCDTRCYDQAKALVSEGAAKIDALIKLQKLDPVPAPPDVQAAYKTAKAMLSALQLKLEVLSAPPPPVAAMPPKADPKKSAAGAAAADPRKAAAAPAAAAAVSMDNFGPLAPLLAEVSFSTKVKLTAMLECLHIPGRRVVRHEPLPPGAVTTLFEHCQATAAPLISDMKQALVQYKQQLLEHHQQQEKEEEQQHGQEPPAAEGGQADVTSPVQLQVPQADEFPLVLHKAFLCTSYNFEQLACFDALVELGRLRLEPGATASLGQEGKDPQQVAAFSATISILAALSQLERQPGARSVKEMAVALQAACPAAATAMPDLLTDASLVLYLAARPLIDGVMCSADKEAGLVKEVLGCLHCCWEAVNLDDAVLRLTCALKLGLLLEEVSELAEARRVLLAARTAAVRFRSQQQQQQRHMPDEHFRWISASRSQPVDATAALLKNMPDSEQELACLHTDVTASFFRVELLIGLAEQQARAARKQLQLQDTIMKREEQSAVFGVRTAKERRLDAARVAAAGTTASNAAVKERELLQSVGKNPYEHALLLMQMAPMQLESHKQVAMLQEAAELLGKAQSWEDQLLAAAHPETSMRVLLPLNPKILLRTPTSCTVTHFPLNLKGSKKAAKYAVFAKCYGAGVGLSLNKTACEYPGTGVPVPLGTPVTVEGLRSNDTYLFAIAAYDEAGAVIGGLGASSPEVLAGLPLPVYLCWSYLVVAACKVKQWAIAHKAAAVLFPHFIVTSPDRPLWEANPMDSQNINRAHLDAAARPLLRAFVQAVYMYTAASPLQHSIELQAEVQPQAGGAGAIQAAGAAGPEFKAPYLEVQVARLKSVKRLLVAMQAAAVLGDEMLVEEGAVRAHNMLAPLLAQRGKSPMLHKALANVHMALQEVRNLVQNSLVEQEGMRRLGARVGAIVSYYLVGLSTSASETSATAYFGKLQLELLKAYDPRFSIPGRPIPLELLPECSSLQDTLLMHPQAASFGAEVLTERLKDDKDLAAKVLALLAGPSPLEACWVHLGRQEALEHPRWVELVTRAVEASVQKGRLEQVKPIAQQVLWHVRTSLQHPPLDFEKWSLEAAMAAVPVPANLPADLEPPKPQLEGLSPEQKAAEEAEYARARQVAVQQYQQRTAAATLLQQRLRVLLQRKRTIEGARSMSKQWMPWLARLNTSLGLVAALEGRTYLLQQQAADERQAAVGPEDVTENVPKGPHPVQAAAPAASSSSAAAAPAAAAGQSDSAAEAPLQALIHLARAAELASRGNAWHEHLNAIRHFWNVARLLLNAGASLMAPTPPITWAEAPLPAPPNPPESLIIPAGKDAKKGGAAGAKKEDPKKAADAKKAAAAAAAKGGKKKGDAPEAPARMFPLPCRSRPNVARCLRSATTALLALVSEMKTGAALFTGVLPPDHGSAGAAADADGLGQGKAAVEGDAASSKFDYGSDLQAELWFQKGPLDMEWLNGFMSMVLLALTKMRRWHSLMGLGQRWLALSEGVFNEKVLPFLLQAANAAGVEAAPMQAAMEAAMRDKSQAVDHLGKVRMLVKERLGVMSLLQGQVATKVKKKRRISVSSRGMPSRPGTSTSFADSTSGLTDNASLVSGYTYRTATTFKTKSSQPDFVRLPVEYDKAIEVLKKRGEKGHMILAVNELGDVHAHFGNWSGATTAWNDALDSLIGPYQVLKSWRKALGPLSSEQMLRKYGVHGLLLAGGILLGKLARYSHYDNLHMRLEAARMSARLLQSVFCCSVMHPQREAGFASYVPLELWDGANLFHDAYRCNMTDLLSGLETVVTILLDNGLPLEALPVVSLWEHVAVHVTRSLHTTVLCRIMRVQALLQLGFMAEASAVLVLLMSAAGLPDHVLQTSFVVKNEDGSVLQAPTIAPFLNQLMPGDAANKAAVSYIAESALPAAVEQLYGSWLVAHINMSRAQFVMKLGEVPNQWKAVHPATGHKVTPDHPLPEACELGLLDKAAALLQQARATANGTSSTPEAAAPAAAKGAKPQSPKGGKAAARASADKRNKEPDRPPSPSKPDNDAAASAQSAEVLLRCLLLSSELELLRWQPLAALGHATAALEHVGGSAGKVNAMLSDNDELERFALTPMLWLKARQQVIKCLAALQHLPDCYGLIATMVAEAGRVHEQVLCTSLLHIKGNLQQLEGRTADAINTYQEVIARYGALHLHDLRLAAVLADLALLQDRLGLRQDSEQGYSQLLSVVAAWTAALGLYEAKEHPELANIYAAGTALHAQVLVHAASSHARQRQLAVAQQHLQHALDILRNFTRASPMQHAATALALARIQRTRALLDTEDGAAGLHPELAGPAVTLHDQLLAVQELLNQVLLTASSDSSHLQLLRGALLELATIHIAGLDAARACVCLRAAFTAANRWSLLLFSSHQLAPVNLSQLPGWAVAFARGQEQHFAKLQGKPAAAAIPDSDLSRMLVCTFTSLLKGLDSLPVAERTQSEAQYLVLHAALRVACPKYSADVCFPDAMLPKPDVPVAGPPPAGTVVVQWYPQDGCWQSEASWNASGSLLLPSVSEADILGLPQPPAFASMLYIIVPNSNSSSSSSSAPRCGELTFSVAAVQALQRQTKALRYCSENPKAPSDLWGEEAPKPHELAAHRRAVERFLRQQQASEDDSDARSSSSNNSNSHAADAAPVAAPAALAATRGAAAAAAAAAATAPSPELQFLVQMEALLSITNGIDVVDPALANWLNQAIPAAD